jgi:hypothetical protein
MTTPSTEDVLPAAVVAPTGAGSARATTVVTADPPEQRQLASTLHQASNLTLPRTPLIGRNHEVATIQQLLLQKQVGLLTLKPVWAEAFRVLRPQGVMLTAFMNPTEYLFDLDRLDNKNVFEVK